MHTTTTRPNGDAPVPFSGNKGNKGGRVARAWQAVWDLLSRSDFKDSVELAEQVAPEFDLKPTSIITHMHRMHEAGALEKIRCTVTTTVQRTVGTPDGGWRTSTYNVKVRRNFYRIAADR